MLVALMLACAQNGTEPESGFRDETPLVVYSGRGEAMVGALLESAETALGFPLEVQYGSTPEVVTRMLAEGSQCPADVVFAQDAGHLGALSERDMLGKLDDGLLAGVGEAFRDSTGKWVGVSGRLRVLVYNSEKVGKEELPKSLAELSDPKWKNRLGWAPTNGSLLSHVSALRHIWGENETREWVEGVAANAKSFPKNAPQVKAADDGVLDIGWVNHYYLHRLEPGDRKAENHSFQPGDAGNLMMVSGAGIRKDSPRAEQGEQLIAWLLEAEAQSHFAQSNYEYPAIPAIPTHPDIKPMEEGLLADVEQDALSDLGRTRQLMQSLGLQ
jgi:iron(III) transport system substrate-binding protein